MKIVMRMAKCITYKTWFCGSFFDQKVRHFILDTWIGLLDFNENTYCNYRNKHRRM